MLENIKERILYWVNIYSSIFPDELSEKVINSMAKNKVGKEILEGVDSNYDTCNNKYESINQNI